MKIKKLISSFTATAMIAAAAQPFSVCDLIAADIEEAPEFTQGENDIFKYNIYSDHIELDGIKKGTEPVVIPAEIDGLPVTDWNYNTSLNFSLSRGFSIAEDNKYFEIIDDCLICTYSMTDIGYIGEYRLENDTYTIPDGIKIIANSAHASDLWMHHINIPDSVEILGFGAFQGSSLEDLYVPKNVHEIGDCALNAGRISSLELSPENPYFDMVDGAIMNEEHTELVHVAPYIESDNYVIPEGIDTIGGNAFINCRKMKAVTIPSTYTGDYRFLERLNSIENIFVSDDNPEYTDMDGVLFSKDLKTLLKFPERKNENGAYVVPEGTEKIGALAFYFNHLNDITFPTTLSEMVGYSLYTTYHYSGVMTFLNPKTPLSRCLTYFTTNYDSETGKTDYLVTVRGYKGSTAERFARDNKANFEAIDDEIPLTTTSKTTTTTTTTATVTTKSTTTATAAISTSKSASASTTTTSTAASTTTAPVTVKGDVNNDGQLSAADLVSMSSFLLGKKNGTVNTDNSDLNGDKNVDVFDLCILRKMLVSKEK